MSLASVCLVPCSSDPVSVAVCRSSSLLATWCSGVGGLGESLFCVAGAHLRWKGIMRVGVPLSLLTVTEAHGAGQHFLKERLSQGKGEWGGGRGFLTHKVSRFQP